MTGPGNGEAPLKADPAAFALRAQPRRVTRLSRRTLVIATAMMTALLFGGLWWALDLHPLKLTSGQELYNTDAKPDDARVGPAGRILPTDQAEAIRTSHRGATTRAAIAG